MNIEKCIMCDAEEWTKESDSDSYTCQRCLILHDLPMDDESLIDSLSRELQRHITE